MSARFELGHGHPPDMTACSDDKNSHSGHSFAPLLLVRIAEDSAVRPVIAGKVRPAHTTLDSGTDIQGIRRLLGCLWSKNRGF
ncbi:Uncharacterised protein [Mycobacteroides abscessus subsp. abscessus]|nr:Uncharacterised protein [Mycobacteroides abscessus subsp. abscessus]